jgi:hypothetical protein
VFALVVDAAQPKSATQPGPQASPANMNHDGFTSPRQPGRMFHRNGRLPKGKPGHTLLLIQACRSLLWQRTLRQLESNGRGVHRQLFSILALNGSGPANQAGLGSSYCDDQFGAAVESDDSRPTIPHFRDALCLPPIFGCAFPDVMMPGPPPNLRFGESEPAKPEAAIPGVQTP